MVIFPVLSFFLICHHQTAYLTLWPQKGCFSSRHYTKAVPPRVRKEVVNVSCLSSPGTPLSHSAPSADLGFRAHWPGLWGAEINVMLLDRDPLGVEESKIKTPKHQKRKKKKKRALDLEIMVSWVQIPALAPYPLCGLVASQVAASAL